MPRKKQAAVVSILNRNNATSGTGFFVHPEGYIMTCAHVLKGCCIWSEEKNKYIARYQTIDGSIHIASLAEAFEDIISRDGKTDGIAILKGEKASDYYRFFARNIEGETVTSHGYPEHTKTQTASGDMSIDSFDTDDLQLGNANNISTGCSGSPVLFEKKPLISTAAAVGMIDSISVSGQRRLQNIAFAMSADLIVRTAREYIEVEPPNLFIKAEDAIETINNGDSCYPDYLNDFCESDQESLIWGIQYGEKYKDSLTSSELWNFANAKHSEGWDVFFTSRNIKEIVKIISSNDCYNSLLILYRSQKQIIEKYLEEIEDSLTGRDTKIKILLVIGKEKKKEIADYINSHSEVSALLYKDENDQMIPFCNLNKT